MDDYLEILEWTLRAGHISPTAPDTLGKAGAAEAGGVCPKKGCRCQFPFSFLSLPGCYPFYKSDPFILTTCPHVYFCGNAPRFQSKLLQGGSRSPCHPPILAGGVTGGLTLLSLQGTRGSGCCW